MATFANGETAHIVMNIINHAVPGGGGMDGSGTTVSVNRFDDGSAFTLRFVGDLEFCNRSLHWHIWPMKWPLCGHYG